MRKQTSFKVSAPILDYFEHIYIINLESRPDRLKEVEAEFEKVGLDFHDPKIHIFKAIKPENFDDWPTQGTKGCYLSHLGVLKDAKKQGFQRILVLEDDVSFVEYFNILMSETINQLEKGASGKIAWDMLYGGYHVAKETQIEITEAYKLKKSFSKNLFKPLPNTEVFCLHFIALTGSSIGKLADYLETLMMKPMGDPTGGRMHVDGAYNWFRREHPETVALLAYPEVASQRSSRTDIHDLKWFDVLPVFKSAAKVARKLKNSFA